MSGPTGPPTVTGQLVRWVPALVVGVALGWCGLGSLGRAAVWLVGLGAMLGLPPVLTAITSALGTRSLRGDVEQTRAMMVEVLRAAVGTGVAPALTALVLAGVLLTVRGSWSGGNGADRGEIEPHAGEPA